MVLRIGVNPGQNLNNDKNNNITVYLIVAGEREYDHILPGLGMELFMLLGAH